jgi:transposase
MRSRCRRGGFAVAAAGVARFARTIQGSSLRSSAWSSCLTLHRTRHLFIRQQTAIINSIRAHLAEFGIVAPVGRRGVERLLEIVADPNDNRLPEVARACVAALGSPGSEGSTHTGHRIIECVELTGT